MKIKKIKILYFIPVIMGIGLGLVFIPNNGREDPASSADNPAPTPGTSQRPASHLGGLKSTSETQIITCQSLLSKAISLSKENSDSRNNDRIITLINNAIDTINKTIANNPTDARGWAQRAKIYQTIRSYMPEAEKYAIANWQQAIKLNPRQTEYYQMLAKIYQQKGPNKTVIYYLQKAVNLEPTNVDLLNQLADQQTKSGQLTSAKNNYQKLLVLLINPEQKEKINQKIASLNKLIAQAGAKIKAKDISEPTTNQQPPDTITLPDTPPKLQAGNLANNMPIIASSPEKEIAENKQETQTNALSGTGIINAGKIQTKICNNHLSPDTQVYLTPESDTENQVLRVVKKAPYNPETGECSHFVTKISTPLDHDLVFRWWIIN